MLNDVIRDSSNEKKPKAVNLMSSCSKYIENSFSCEEIVIKITLNRKKTK